MGSTHLHYPRVLTIAGSDSGGGAGVQADLKTLSALGCYGMTAITALTAQNTQGVRAIHSVPAQHLAQEVDAVLSDIGAHAIKIGMLYGADLVKVVAQAIRQHNAAHGQQPVHVVLDPVMVASSGDALMTQETVAVVQQELFALATVITPNLDEAALFLHEPVIGQAQMSQAARALQKLGARNVLLKGGHLPGDDLLDLLLLEDGREVRFESPRIASANTHGTGCTLSSALAAKLAQGQGLEQATAEARAYVLGAIAAGAQVRTGHGHGPLNHGFAPQAMHLLRTEL